MASNFRATYHSQDIKEKRHLWIIGGGIGTIIMGFMFLILFAGAWAGWLLIIAAFVAGGATLWISNFGAKWDNLSAGDKAKVLPGVIIGILFVVCAIIAYFFLRWFYRPR